MERFNVRCPDHYPMKCSLSKPDKDYLLTPEKYKAFFIFQYKGQDDWLEPTLRKYFSERTWRLYNAGLEGGTGTKFCNVCRYALASDFGIVSLTPLNYNVFQEIGLMQGLQKPVLYLLNPNRKEKLPFDIDDQIYVEHTNDARKLLELFVLEGDFFIPQADLVRHAKINFGEKYETFVNELINNNFILKELGTVGTKKLVFCRFNENYRKDLEEMLWE